MTCLNCLNNGEVPTKWESVHIDTGDGRPGGYYVGQEPTAFDWCDCDQGQRMKAAEMARLADEALYYDERAAMDCGF